MQLRDTATRFGLVSRALHWVMAGLILWQLTGMVLKQLLGRHPLVAGFVQVHQTVGLIVLGLVVLRILWALANRAGRPKHGADLAGRVAGLGHKALYLLMLLVPVLGILRANTRGAPPRPAAAGVPAQQLPTPEVDPWLAAIAAIHGPLAWTLLVLILGHVAMAIAHAMIWRDGATDTMFGRIRG